MSDSNRFKGSTLLYLVTEDWYFCSHRLELGRAAREAGYDVVVVTRVNRHGKRIRDAGLRIIPVDMRRGQFSGWREVVLLATLWRIYRRERPQIVHHIALKPVLYGSLVAWARRVPVVVASITGLGSIFVGEEPRVRRLRGLVRGALGGLLRASQSQVIVQNPDDQELMQSLRVPAERIELIRGAGVDTEYLRPKPEPSGPVIAAMVSRMLRDKGVFELVEAARIIRGKGAGVTVRLVGPLDAANPSSIDKAMLESWVAEGVVEWPGAVRDVRPVWAAAHFAVLPSYREGLPKSLLEAAACGRPLVATDVPGCRDIVVHEKTGLLVPPRDPQSLAEAMLRLAQDPTLRAQLGRAARERVEQHFSVDKVVKKTLSLYRSILAAA